VKFILASSSPRRRELLSMIGLDFDVLPSNVPEVRAAGEAPEEYVARLSRDNAADTTVLYGEELLEKPEDAADAARMLATIAGKTHIVYTGVTVENVEKGWRDTRVAESEVRMLPLSKEDIDWYVATGEPFGKAGAYAIQGYGSMFIDSVHGSYTNVVGLPLATLFQMLRRAGVDPLTKRPE
jgi:septum formation protein